MATFSGNGGVVKIGSNTVAEVTDFTVEESVTPYEDTAMGDTWRSHIAASGFKEWTAKVTCWWDDTDTNGQEAMTLGASVSLKLYTEGDSASDDEITGTASVTKIGVSANKDGIVTREFELMGNGALTHGTVSGA